MDNPKAIVGALGALAALAAPVQSVRAAPPSQGSAQPTNKTVIELSLEVRHDSNVARANAARAASEGLTLADERLTPQLSVTVARPLSLLRVSLDASVGYDFYRRNHRLNRERLSLAGDASLPFSLCELEFTPTLSRRQSDLADIQAATRGSIRNAETIQDYLGTVRCGHRYGLRPMALVERSTGQNSNPLRQISDYRTTRWGGGLVYASPVFGTLETSYRHGDTVYPHRLIGAGQDGYSIDTVQARLDRSLGSLLTGTLEGGYSHLQPRRPGVPVFNGFVWDFELAAAVTPHLRLDASVARKLAPSLTVDALYRVDTVYQISQSYYFNSLISLRLTEGFEKHHFAGAGTALGPLLTGDSRRDVLAILSYARSPRLRFGVEAGYETRDAPGNFYDYNDLHFGLQSRFSF